MRMLTFTATAFEQAMNWGKQDGKIQQKIATLMFDILRNPFTGLGKPEPLKYGEYKGYWSRRITDEHRLIYKVTEEAIIIVSCKFHYP